MDLWKNLRPDAADWGWRCERLMRDEINESLALIFQGIDRLKVAFPQRRFTIDGRLVGDVGEIIAQLEYDIELDKVSRPGHDAKCGTREVQIKATFKDSLTFSSCPDYYLGFKLYRDGRHEEIFNGPGELIRKRFATRKDIGQKLLSFSLKELIALNKTVNDADRIPKRRAAPGRP